MGRQGPLPYQDGMPYWVFAQAPVHLGWASPSPSPSPTPTVVSLDLTPVNATVSVEAITDNVQADVKLQQGDTIKVDQRLF